ncbi:phosphoribosylformylglycinamidine synthase subunit PurQ [Halanaerobiaceae bacterium Z-7014]|uniref:Phosphoribosylformylglycinamidine synthase subunit PurQ n=1 Tax=Halonatronomonas betaini TaxID=2778430 RepID=A0A931AU57_9FIRM|nr:phosphoribosylformylglycinamidine synthase subunit PurQ [Halonatronomonas betaini]MBF8436845.1 phosphoribosylformylglycinamidine synthase subunit PurQ [Halonatronomonas betaini]
MRFGIVTFPGSNCDQDLRYVIEDIFEIEIDMIWHKEKFKNNYDAILLPGGFSYGDYLRSGAIARFSPVMDSVIEFANNGGTVLGICNGFQILMEAGLLPGAMKVNDNLKFVCKHVKLQVENDRTPFTRKLEINQILDIPVAHQEGNFYIDDAGLKELKANNQIVLKYLDDSENPNGSIDNIAGICNKKRNVFGLMPHPERASEEILGSSDGKKIFESLISYLKEGVN